MHSADFKVKTKTKTIQVGFSAFWLRSGVENNSRDTLISEMLKCEY